MKYDKGLQEEIRKKHECMDVGRARLNQLKRHQMELNLDNSEPIVYSLVTKREVTHGPRGSVSDLQSSNGSKFVTGGGQSSSEVRNSMDNLTDTILNLLKKRLIDIQKRIEAQEESLCTMEMELKILEDRATLVEIRHLEELVRLDH